MDFCNDTAATEIYTLSLHDALPILAVDGAGWHVAHALRIPGNVTLVLLPPYSPELIRSSGSGCSCASDTSATACSRATMRSSMRSAPPGTPSPQRGCFP